MEFIVRGKIANIVVHTREGAAWNFNVPFDGSPVVIRDSYSAEHPFEPYLKREFEILANIPQSPSKKLLLEHV